MSGLIQHVLEVHDAGLQHPTVTAPPVVSHLLGGPCPLGRYISGKPLPCSIASSGTPVALTAALSSNDICSAALNRSGRLSCLKACQAVSSSVMVPPAEVPPAIAPASAAAAILLLQHFLVLNLLPLHHFELLVAADRQPRFRRTVCWPVPDPLPPGLVRVQPPRRRRTPPQSGRR